MDLSKFIVVGENIHCTRAYKLDGAFVKAAAGRYGIVYRADGESRQLPVPDVFTAGADWQAGRVKHCAVAVWQGNYGAREDRAAGIDYLRHLAARQEAAGASYLDINLDEFSTDVAQRAELMKWTVGIVQQASSLPVSVDSSNLEILRAGLEAADRTRGRPMVNSVSLERLEAVGLAADHEAVVIASAAGAGALPATAAERLANVEALMSGLKDRGFEDDAICVDPLVFPISVDGANGRTFIEAVTALRRRYGSGIHIVAGLSNVSFGMPNRRLINQVFSRLAVEAGADGGIVDPTQINAGTLRAMDPESEPYRLARALLLGEDEFGMEFIAACREGRI